MSEPGIPGTEPNADDPVLTLRSDDVTWTTTADEIVALDLRTSRYLTVTETGVELWEALARGATKSELIAKLQARYDIESQIAAGDVTAFIADMRARDLLRE